MQKVRIEAISLEHLFPGPENYTGPNPVNILASTDGILPINIVPTLAQYCALLALSRVFTPLRNGRVSEGYESRRLAVRRTP
jgi:hypothetical protein